MVSAGLTKEFGVLGSDSAMYDAGKGITTFESPKLLLTSGRTVVSYIGTYLYFANIDMGKFSLPFDAQCLYLAEYLAKTRDSVAKTMKENIKDPDEQKPHFCLFVLGFHQGFPTLAQLNSFKNFEPMYMHSENGIKFSTILYGDDSIPGKKQIFKESTEYMEKKAEKYSHLTPGLVGEILTRGIYRKADLETKIGTKRKYAGGICNAAMVNKDGVIPLSGFQVN